MVRPKKDAKDRKSVDLRIPVTKEQKALIAKAVKLEKQEFATWARTILLDAATNRVAQDRARKPKQD